MKSLKNIRKPAGENTEGNGDESSLVTTELENSITNEITLKLGGKEKPSGIKISTGSRMKSASVLNLGKNINLKNSVPNLGDSLTNSVNKKELNQSKTLRDSSSLSKPKLYSGSKSKSQQKKKPILT